MASNNAEMPVSSTSEMRETNSRPDVRSRGGMHRGAARGRNSRGRGEGRGRGAGRGRGGDRTQHATDAGSAETQGQDQIQLNGNTIMTSLPTSAAKSMGKTIDEEEDVEAEVCFICASPVVHNCIAPCNHRTCHICGLRLRALYKTKACAHCRTTAEVVIFTDNAEKRFEDFTPTDFYRKDDNLGINYENQETFEDTVLLLRYNCPDSTCDVACLGWPDLHRHVKTIHHKVMCDLCTRNKKVFTHEHELFSPADLKKHEKYGDDNPGAVDQSGFTGHPECGFCRMRFYGDDELYTHCRDRHERCHICDRRTGGRQPQYYVDYNALEVHFRKDHFQCPDTECLEKKFVVFDSELDLKAHQLEAHPNGLTKDARRDARRIDMSGFDYREHYQDDRGGRGGRERGRGRGATRGRGRDPNAEPLPVSSAQPMRRDEVAYQRSMAIQSAQSVTSRTFGGQLTQSDAFAARPPPNAREPATVTAAHPPSNRDNVASGVDNLRLGPSDDSTPPTPSAPLTPAEQARRLRHNAVTERAANMLGNDATKLSEFRNKVSAYRSSAIKAPDLIDAFFVLFDTTGSAELGKLVKELADIFEVASKRDDLVRAWSDWKAVNEDYPSLPGPSGSTNASTWGAGIGGSRVLKLKSSTAQSSRSAVSKKGSWGGSAAAGTNTNGGLFPPLAASAASSRAAGGASHKTPAWLSAASSTASSARASPMPSPRVGPSQPPRSDAFPALPAGKKPLSSTFSPGYTGAGVRRPNPAAPSSFSWGAGGLVANGAAATPNGSGVDDSGADTSEGQARKKGGKGKKQVLFNWG